jgi:hypothetical protein
MRKILIAPLLLFAFVVLQSGKCKNSVATSSGGGGSSTATCNLYTATSWTAGVPAGSNCTSYPTFGNDPNYDIGSQSDGDNGKRYTTATWTEYVPGVGTSTNGPFPWVAKSPFTTGVPYGNTSWHLIFFQKDLCKSCITVYQATDSRYHNTRQIWRSDKVYTGNPGSITIMPEASTNEYQICP